MKSFSKIIYIVARVILGAVFIYASWDKILHPAGFAKIVENYRILPPFLVNIPAIFIPWIEFLCGVFLIVGIFVGGSSLIIFILLIFFIFALSSATLRGIDTACGCFSTSFETSKVGIERIIEDLVLLIICIYVLVYWKAKKVVSPK